MRNFLFCSLFLIGCTGGEGDEGGTSVSGQAVYRDATTDHSGTQRSPSSPPAQEAKLSMTIKGTGTIPQVDPQCVTDPAGKFEARYLGMASIDDNVYLASFASGKITTPSGCEIPELTVGVVTEIVVRGELNTTTQNCQTYCEASARADAEAQCGASSSAAACRAQAESSAAAQCNTTCTTQKTKIVAETTIGVGTLGQVDASSLRSATFADLEGKLVFDALE